MQAKTLINNNEIDIHDDILLVSKTDTKSLICYANPAFCHVSGYRELELIGKPHNIVRHPDMPKVVFKIMWDSLKLNREFNGYIKNLTKQGNYYWVFANVTPSYDENNELTGYTSIRRKPNIEKLEYIKELYAELLEIEQQTKSNDVIEKSHYRLNSILNAKEKGYDEFILTI